MTTDSNQNTNPSPQGAQMNSLNGTPTGDPPLEARASATSAYPLVATGLNGAAARHAWWSRIFTRNSGESS